MSEARPKYGCRLSVLLCSLISLHYIYIHVIVIKNITHKVFAAVAVWPSVLDLHTAFRSHAS